MEEGTERGIWDFERATEHFHRKERLREELELGQLSVGLHKPKITSL